MFALCYSGKWSLATVCMFAAYLKLRERHVVLKYLATLNEKIESCAADEQEAPSWCSKVCCFCETSLILVVVQGFCAGLKSRLALSLKH